MRSDRYVGGIFLIAIGTLFLLSNLGYISWSIIGNIIELWPLILVVIGVNIIAKNHPVVKGITWLLFFVVFIGYGMFYGQISNRTNNPLSNTLSYNKHSETERGSLNIDFGGAKLDLVATDDSLIETYTNNQGVRPSVKYSNGNRAVVVDLKSNKNVIFSIGNDNYSYQIGLNRDVAWDIDADLGAVSGRMDLSELKVDKLKLDLGASNLEIVLGDKNPISEIIIDAGTSNLDFVIPKDLGVKLKVDGLISKTSISKLGWQFQDGYYITPDYNNATSKALIDLDMGVGKLDIRVR